MGLILAASAMQFVIDGLGDAFPKLFGPERAAASFEWAAAVLSFLG